MENVNVTSDIIGIQADTNWAEVPSIRISMWN